MKIYTVTLTEQERAITLELINMALKAGGLPVAEAALVLSKRISEAAEVAPPLAEPDLKLVGSAA